jgi:hypothetical protein
VLGKKGARATLSAAQRCLIDQLMDSAAIKSRRANNEEHKGDFLVELPSGETDIATGKTVLRVLDVLEEQTRVLRRAVDDSRWAGDVAERPAASRKKAAKK